MSTLGHALPDGVAAAQPAPAGLALPPAADDAERAEVRSSQSGLLALAAFVVVVLWVAIALVIRQDYENTGRQAEVNLSNLSRAFAEHTAKTLEGADQAVRFVRSEYLAHGAGLDIPKYLASQAIIDSDYHLLTVIGADGYVSHSSRPFTRVDLHEREHFRVHANAQDDSLFVSKPVLGKVSGKWSIQITRRIDEPDGRFGGVVVVSMPPSYFTRFYQEVDLGAHGAISLVGMDGFVRARASADGQQQGQDLRGSALFQAMLAQKNGVLQMRSSIDQVERLYAFRTLEAYRLIVVSGTGVDDAFQEADRRRSLAIFLGSGVTGVLLILTASLYRRIRRQALLMTELHASRLKAEEASQLKSKFLASVSHELRTPLHGILGYSELIRDTSADAQAQEFGGIIHDSARHLHSLVNTILDLAKIESGHVVPVFDAIELSPLLEETYRLHAVHAHGRGLDFSLDVDASCPAQITTDRTRLLQVLGNIVNNAIKFTDRGRIVLSATVEQGRLMLRVRDNGIGIAADRLGEVFTRFHGVTAELVHCNQGAGLGLPLAKELTELLGGTLSIRSELGSGTEVCVSLPIETNTAERPTHDHA
jgi:two-component system sensor histidine kinase BarA